MAGRARFHAKTPEERQEMYRKQNIRRRRETRERKEFALRAIDILRKRGFDMADLAAIGHIAETSFSRWTRGKVRPNLMAEEKIAVLLEVTAEYATGDTIAYGKRWPHPDRELLRRRAAPAIAAIEAKRRT